jgi:hypothetical protein
VVNVRVGEQLGIHALREICPCVRAVRKDVFTQILYPGHHLLETDLMVSRGLFNRDIWHDIAPSVNNACNLQSGMTGPAARRLMIDDSYECHQEDSASNFPDKTVRKMPRPQPEGTPDEQFEVKGYDDLRLQLLLRALPVYPLPVQDVTLDFTSKHLSMR